MKIEKILIIMVVTAFLLAACSPQSQTPTPAAPAENTVLTPSGPAACSAVSVLPTPGPTETSLYPAPSDQDWRLGPDNAAVTFMEYSDLQCPYCANFAPVLKQVQAENPDKVRIVFRHFPLPMHQHALLAAQAAEAAGLQDKFWEMHDVIFAGQAEWSDLPAADVENWLTARAAQIGLDAERFTADLKSEAVVKKTLDAQQAAQKANIPGTPFLLINGKPYEGPRDPASLNSFVKLIDLIPSQYTECPQMTIDASKTYLATITTTRGDIVLELYPDKAPMTVNSFVFLARDGWFDNVLFHRVIPGFVAQTGDPTGTGFGGPGYFFDNEITPDLTFDEAGMVGMANSGEGSNGSQFFITYSAQPKLNGKYTVFGKIISGMDVAASLTPRDPSAGGDLPEGDKILKVAIQEK